MSLRKKFADSPRVQGFFARRIEGLVRRAHRLSQWQRLGFEPMEDSLRAGEPVIVVLWHQRLMMSPYLFPTDLGRIATLTSAARAGRMAGLFQTRFGMETIAMSSHQRHVAMSRQILGLMREGCSIGIAADGPRGPARVCSKVPLIWARASGKRVFLVTFAADRVRELPTWDRMWLPRAGSRGVLMCREWTTEVPRKMSETEEEVLRRDLEAALNALSDDADASVAALRRH
ncbi:lysophospholipid acyltransferase family protein [Shimia sp.]|uniref:lysophospholipid acyltransferase family protein n=1 Tax=Shimia sp. TaxID=1954381 RepID=UPI003566FF03